MSHNSTDTKEVLADIYSDDATRSQLAMTQIVSACISLVASCGIVVMLWRSGLSTSPYRRILFALSMSDIWQSLALATGPFALPLEAHQGLVGFVRGNTETCEANGLAMVFGAAAVPMYTCLLTYYYYCKLCKNQTDGVFHNKVERHAHIFILSFCVVVGLAGIITGTINGSPAGYVCSFSSSPAGCILFEETVGACERGQHSPTFVILFLFAMPFLSFVGVFLVSAMISIHAIKKARIYNKGKQHRYYQQQQQQQKKRYHTTNNNNNNKHDYDSDGYSKEDSSSNDNKTDEDYRSDNDDHKSMQSSYHSTTNSIIDQETHKKRNTTRSHHHQDDHHQKNDDNKNTAKKWEDDNNEESSDNNKKSKRSSHRLMETTIMTKPNSYSRQSSSSNNNHDENSHKNNLIMMVGGVEVVVPVVATESNNSAAEEQEEVAIRIYRREILVQAILYAISFILVYSNLFLQYFLHIFGGLSPLFLLFMLRFFYPLGGLFNIMIWARPKVVQLRQRYPVYNSLQALYLVLKAGGEIPDLSSNNHRHSQNSSSSCCYCGILRQKNNHQNNEEEEQLSDHHHSRQKKELSDNNNNNNKSAAIINSDDLRAQQSFDELVANGGASNHWNSSNNICGGVSESSSVDKNAVVWSDLAIGAAKNKEAAKKRKANKRKQANKNNGIIINGW